MGQTINVSATREAAGWTCQVKIEEGGALVSDHTVEVSASDAKRLSPESSVEDLVRRSFEFLLEREPPQSILRHFTLADIERYFPGYSEVIRA